MSHLEVLRDSGKQATTALPSTGKTTRWDFLPKNSTKSRVYSLVIPRSFFQFYRAVINAVDATAATCRVTFTDYGNTEDVSLNDVKVIPKSAWVCVFLIASIFYQLLTLKCVFTVFRIQTEFKGKFL